MSGIDPHFAVSPETSAETAVRLTRELAQARAETRQATENLRDRFAMAALTGLITSNPGFYEEGSRIAYVSGLAFDIADKMMALRR